MNAEVGQPIQAFRHEALLYSGRASFLAGTVPFIRGGLAAGEPVLVVESNEKIGLLRSALNRDAAGVYFADMAEVGSNPARIIPAWRDFVTAHGGAGRRVRGIGEPIWAGRSPTELIECQRHESLLNVAFAPGVPWWLLCPYDTGQLDASVVDEARRSHEFVSRGGKHMNSVNYRGLAGSGAPFDAPLSEPTRVSRSITFTLDSLAEVRGLVADVSTRAGFDSTRTSNLVLAVNEVATNSLRHGGGAGSLRIWKDASTLTCEVRDGGRFDDPLADRTRPGPAPSGPRGLWLANQLCDLVQIRTLPDGTVARLHMWRSPGQRSQAPIN